MLHVSSITVEVSSGKVRYRPDKGREDAAGDSTDMVALGPSGAHRRVRTLTTTRAERWSAQMGSDELVVARSSCWYGGRVDQARMGLHRFRGGGSAGLAPRIAAVGALQITPTWLAELHRVIDLGPGSVGARSPSSPTRRPVGAPCRYGNRR